MRRRPNHSTYIHTHKELRNALLKDFTTVASWESDKVTPPIFEGRQQRQRQKKSFRWPSSEINTYFFTIYWDKIQSWCLIWCAIICHVSREIIYVFNLIKSSFPLVSRAKCCDRDFEVGFYALPIKNIYLYVLMTLTMARWIRFQFSVTEFKQTITRFPNQSLMIRNQSHRDGSDYFDVIKCSARTFPNGSRYLSAVDFFCSFIFFFLCFVFSFSFGVRVSCTRNLSRGINISHYLVNRFVSQATKRVREATHTENWIDLGM